VKVLFAALVLALAFAGAAHAQPNVVIVVTDDQRVQTLGPKRTPAIWNLIRRQGVAYRNAFVPTSVCCPSRSSILTGLYAHSHGVYSNDVPNNGGWPTFYAHGMEDRTLAVKLRNVGYRTGLVGKYLNGGPPYPGHVPVGWDVFEEFPSGYYGYTLAGRTFGTAPSDYSTDVLRDRAVQFIRETPAGQPLFLYFAPYAPHSGSIPAPRHDGSWTGRAWTRRLPASFREDLSDKPPWIRRLPQTRRAKFVGILERRAETMMAVDDAVAGIVGELETAGRMQDTLFVFLSDNGILLGEHHVYGAKNLPYRLATQVPMLARWDGHIRSGSTARRLALNLDLAPTIAHATGATMQTEGLNLLGSVQRRGFPLEGAAWRHTARLRVPAFCGYRTLRFMYARYRNGFQELYDYRRDPQELRNIAVARPKLRRYLRAQAHRLCAPKPPGFRWVSAGS
jgi:arylsulfatase A-like enzyme